MKRSKRQENGIIIHFILYFILTVGLLVFIFTSIIPQLKEIEQTKDNTKALYSSIKRIEKSGLSYKEFLSSNNPSNNNRIISEIIKNLTESFYTENLVNTEEADYQTFLDKKEADLNSPTNLAKIEEKTEKLSLILPSYTDTGVDFGNETLTDYRFINYIESILQTFNLSTNNPIGINKVEILEEFIGTKNNTDPLDSNLFYIPLNLTLSGKKEGIINFLYFVENVGKINIDKDDILINENYGLLSKNGRKIILEGDKFSIDYNIFEHQIIDIEKITMPTYIDSSYLSRGESDFQEFIIQKQGDDVFDIAVNLMFYVKGQPIYKIEEFILSVLDKHKEATKLASNILKDPKTDKIKYQKVTNYNKTLKQLGDKVLTIRKELAKKDKIEELYKNTILIDKQIDPIFTNLKE